MSGKIETVHAFKHSKSYINKLYNFVRVYEDWYTVKTMNFYKMKQSANGVASLEYSTVLLKY